MRLRPVGALLASLVMAVPASAQNLESFRFQTDNDWFDFWKRSRFRPDIEYTHGEIIRAVYNSAPHWMLFGGQNCKVARREAPHVPPCVQSFFEATQKIYNPAHDSYTPEPGERPYAGILFAEYGRQKVSPRLESAIGAVIGTTGVLSGAESVQKTFHKLADLRPLLGWDHQIANEAVLGMEYSSRYLLTPPRPGRRSAATVAARGTAIATTVLSGASAGVEIHAGHNAPHPWMPTADADRRRLRAYAILGANESWVARNVLLDGNSDETRGLVKKRPFVFESVWGLAVGFGGYFLEYRAVSLAREYYSGPSWHRWGAISLIVGTP